jgi:periplasmic divalent cation tolerance protein
VTDVRVVLVTAPCGDPAAALARRLVEEGLAACVNRVPGVRSVYRWQGEVCDDGEDLLVIKTAADRVEDLVARVRELHGYEVPEVLVLAVEAGSAPYLEWVLAQPRPA